MQRLIRSASLLLRRYPIRRRLMAVYLIQVALVVLWCCILAVSELQNTFSIVTLGNAQIVNTVTENLRSALEDLQTVTKFPVLRVNQLTNFTYNYLSNPQDYSRYTFETELRNQCRNLFGLHPGVTSISVFESTGQGLSQRSDQRYLYNQSLEEYGSVPQIQASQPWFQSTMAERGAPFAWSAQEIAASGIAAEEGWIFCSRSVFNIDRFENVGAVLVGADMSGSLRLFEQNRAYQSERMGVYNREGRLMLGSLPAETFTALDDCAPGKISSFVLRTDRGHMLMTCSTVLEDYVCLVETPCREVLFTALRQRAWLLPPLVLLLLFIMLFTNLIVSSITHPILRLERACGQIRQGNWSVNLYDDCPDELGQFTRSFDDMAREIRTLIAEVYEKDLLSSQLELQMLREQINPHFLYNTLESIRSAAILKGETELGEMAYLLAKTLRYGVSQTQGTVTVRQELDNLDDYMRLQKLRYQDRVTFSLQIDERLYPCRIIRLLLQPLVENALYHGVSSLESGGRVEILGFCEGDVITFQVTDNGVGIDAETLARLNDYIQGKNESFRSIGVKNVCRRIQLHYGEEFGVTISSQPGRGTMVTVRVPRDGEDKGKEGHDCTIS